MCVNGLVARDFDVARTEERAGEMLRQGVRRWIREAASGEQCAKDSFHAC
jgi:hypothetical protein